MRKPFSDDDGGTRRSVYDTDPVAEPDLWFLPGPPDDRAPTDPPWNIAPRETGNLAQEWRRAEAAQYRALIDAATALARFGERLRSAPDGMAERIALSTVAALLRAEGVWIGAERIALYRALRVASDDSARDLARAAWAVRRLTRAGESPLNGVETFLGRSAVHDPQSPLAGDRAVGNELGVLGHDWIAAVDTLADAHPLTQAAYGLAQWRAQGLTPWHETLEPSVAALQIGAGDLAAFLPVTEGHRLDRDALTGTPESRLAAFCAATRAGALNALMEMDRLSAWNLRAQRATADLSGRTPPRAIAAFTRYPIFSAELLADAAGCSRPAARRNLAIFETRGLIQEVTGQERYRFWSARI